MKPLEGNPYLEADVLPVDIVLHPSWWHRHAGICFDEDFFFHPLRRVEVERKMEQVLFERWGSYGLGTDRSQNLPIVGPVHLSAGFIVSGMLGCQIEYGADCSPKVKCAALPELTIDPQAAFKSESYSRFEHLKESLSARYGYLTGDINWNGILNIALDLRGEQLFLDLYDHAEKVKRFLEGIAWVLVRFTQLMQTETGSTSISVNRNVRHFRKPILLHSQCSHTMISMQDYEQHLMGFDIAWCQRQRPYGIHYCGSDPHRFAEVYSRLPHLDFLDVGWGGDIRLLRKHLPDTFFNLRLSPVELIGMDPDQIEKTIIDLVRASGNPRLTGICCINIDDKVSEDKISAIFKTVEELRMAGLSPL